MAWQCGHARYHLNFESTYLEMPELGGRCPLVFTTLVNRAMPLIRFSIGDQATVSDEPCACGRQSAWLSQIEGREGELITLPSGRRLSPYLLTTVIEADASILQYRIVQTAPANFRIDVVRRPKSWASAARRRSVRRASRVAAENVDFSLRDSRIARAA